MWRAATAVAISGSKKATRFLPRALAEYIATSALRSSSSAEPKPGWPAATPMLTGAFAAAPSCAGAGPERPDQALGDAPRDGHLRGIPEEDRELVAADPGREVPGPQGRLDALADGREELVARGVAEGVVDDLEVVEVEEQDDRDQPGRVGRLEALGHALGEERPVGEPGQGVVVGLVLELVLESRQGAERLFQLAVLERDRRVAGERLEQLEIVGVERAAGRSGGSRRGSCPTRRDSPTSGA